MQDDKSPQEIVTALMAGDAGRDHRQVHVMDRHGRIAAHTGKACVDWRGQSAARGIRSQATC